MIFGKTTQVTGLIFENKINGCEVTQVRSKDFVQGDSTLQLRVWGHCKLPSRSRAEPYWRPWAKLLEAQQLYAFYSSKMVSPYFGGHFDERLR